MANRISNRIKKEKDKGLYKQLFSLVFPITLQNLMMCLVSTSDAVMSGMLNQDSLSAGLLAGKLPAAPGRTYGNVPNARIVSSSLVTG